MMQNELAEDGKLEGQIVKEEMQKQTSREVGRNEYAPWLDSSTHGKKIRLGGN